jgi:drug/metabolite transporter (DMT)-like permease
MSSLFWAGAFIAGKLGVNELSPISLTFFRFFFASIIIFIIMVKYEKKDWKLKGKDWLPVIITGIVGMVGYHIFFFTALKYTEASNASILAATNPIVTAVLASYFIDEKLGIKRIMILILALVGVVLTITNWDLSILINLTFNKGDLIMLVAVTCWAIYSVIVKKVMDRYSPLILTTYSFIVCTLVLLPFVIKEFMQTSILDISIRGWMPVLYMAVFPTVIGYLIQQMSIKEIGASKTAIFINLVPVFSVILATAILGEELGILRLVSGSIIILAVYLNSKIKAKATNDLEMNTNNIS